jgi:general secretion pathway protein L
MKTPSAHSTLYIRLPSKSAGKTMQQWLAQPMPFAILGRNGRIQRSGETPLPNLSGQIAQMPRVVLMLAASDVTLLHLGVPPLPAAKLKAALPALVEDSLITDPAECVMVAGPEVQGLRTIAVVDKLWLQSIVSTLRQWHARRIVALPMQLCLPLPATGAAAAVTEMPGQIDLAVRLSAFDGMGLPIVPEQTGGAVEAEVLRALSSLASQRRFELSVPAARLTAYRDAAKELQSGGFEIAVQEESWPGLLESANAVPLDLMTGLDTTTAFVVDWRRWRWPLALASLLLLVNVSALNWDWWRLRSEGEDLRAAMTRIYKSSFPNDSVIIDPVRQMQQKVALVRQRAGEMAPDDFIALTAVLGEAWQAMQTEPGAKSDQIAALEYRDLTLSVRFKPGANPPLEPARVALAARGAALTVAPEQGDAKVWQIRSAP